MLISLLFDFNKNKEGEYEGDTRGLSNNIINIDYIRE